MHCRVGARRRMAGCNAGAGRVHHSPEFDARCAPVHVEHPDDGYQGAAEGDWIPKRGHGQCIRDLCLRYAPGEQALAPVEIPSDPFGIQLFLGTIDGKSHGIDCTGVNSWPDASSVWGGPMQYVVKHVDVSSVAPVRAMWSPEDFGGTSKIPTSGSFSVTCLLPPGAVIYLGSMISNEEVGN
jgi:hypothetical protein